MTPPGSLVTLTIDKLVYGGDALARHPDGRAVFVPFALPGETVQARVVEEKRGHLRAEIVALLEPSPQRIPPRCPHAFNINTPQLPACGGCHYQHLDHANQVEAKSAILGDQLQRIGKVTEPPMQEAVASPRAWNYRNHVQFHVAKDGRLGYVSTDGRSILPVSECHLPEPPLDEDLRILHFDPAEGIERVSLRRGSAGEVMLIVASDAPPKIEVPPGISVVHLRGDKAHGLAGEPFLHMDVSGQTFRLSPAAFFQVNTPVAEQMVDRVLEALPLPAGGNLLDVYCGAGLFSVFYARRGVRVTGIESSPAACADFTANLDAYPDVELYEGTAEDILPCLTLQPDAILLDPPRAGLHPRVIEALLKLSPPRIACFSCDPSTLARDTRRLLDGGYHQLSLTPFDLFPQTYHIEALAVFAQAHV